MFSLQAFFNKTDPHIFKRIPLEASGELYASPMPFSKFDPSNDMVKFYGTHNINHIFVLVTDKELSAKARRPVLKAYDKKGFSYSRFVIGDYQAPSLDVLTALVEEASLRLNNREKIVVHCHAGVGRTSLALSCIIIGIEKASAEEAIRRVKDNIAVNITNEQLRVTEKFAITISN